MANKSTPVMPPTKTSTTSAITLGSKIAHSGDEPGVHITKNGPRGAQKGPTLKGR